MIEVYSNDNANFSYNGNMTLQPTECILSWGADGTMSISLTHDIDEMGRWRYLQNDNVIACPTPYSDKQLFRIYHVNKTDNEIKVDARHIVFDLLGTLLKNVSLNDCNGQEALDAMLEGTVYTGWSDIESCYSANYDMINTIEALFGEESDEYVSFISALGGERIYDNFTIKLYANAGHDRGVVIEPYRNLIGIEGDDSIDEVVTRIYPVGYNDYRLDPSEPYIDSPLLSNYATVHEKKIIYEDVKLLEDCEKDDSGNYIENGYKTIEELREELKRRALLSFSLEGIDKPTVNYKVNMLELEGMPGYTDFAKYEKVELYDTVTCRYPDIGIDVSAKVIMIEWDCLSKRNLSFEIGDFIENIFDRLTTSNHSSSSSTALKAAESALKAAEAAMQAAKDKEAAEEYYNKVLEMYNELIESKSEG